MTGRSPGRKRELTGLKRSTISSPGKKKRFQNCKSPISEEGQKDRARGTRGLCNELKKECRDLITEHLAGRSAKVEDIPGECREIPIFLG